MTRVIDFGQVALCNDLIFGLCVHTETGWVPFAKGTDEQKAWVRSQVVSHPFRKCLSDSMEEELFGKSAKE